MKRPGRNTEAALWAALIPPVLWLAAALAQAIDRGGGLAGLVAHLSVLMASPLSLRWSASTGKFLLLAVVCYPLAVFCYLDEKSRQRPGAEYGTARWGSAFALNRKYRDRRHPSENYVFTSHVQMGMDSFRHKHNLNVVVIGGSGAGKTRFYVKPNLMQCAENCSYIILDSKGEILRSVGGLFERMGITVTVVDLVHFKGHYNPMAYLETDEDAIKLAHALVHNTKPKDAPASGDKFWDDSSMMLISALILYLMYEAPAEEQNFAMLMYMILNCQLTEGEAGPNPLELLFEELEGQAPDHPAVLQFHSFKLGSTKTLQSVLISAAANLYMFNTRRFAEMTSRDETFLPQLGTERRAIFCVIPDHDQTYNFLITILYTQIFDQLFRLADSQPDYHGALPMHVRCMMDEFANVALPKNFQNILSVCRSRNISCDIILQNIAQIKKLFKDDWEGLLGNCDTMLYLGGNEFGTFEYLSKILGKETERTTSQSIGKGSRGSSSESRQSAGRELLTPDEVRRIERGDALLLMSSENPVIDKKYDILKHPNTRSTPDGGGKPYVMPHDYMGDAATLPAAEIETLEPDKVPAETLQHYEWIELEEINEEDEKK